MQKEWLLWRLLAAWCSAVQGLTCSYLVSERTVSLPLRHLPRPWAKGASSRQRLTQSSLYRHCRASIPAENCSQTLTSLDPKGQLWCMCVGPNQPHTQKTQSTLGLVIEARQIWDFLKVHGFRRAQSFQDVLVSCQVSGTELHLSIFYS
jgi:hypothetical protein